MSDISRVEERKVYSSKTEFKVGDLLLKSYKGKLKKGHFEGQGTLTFVDYFNDEYVYRG